MKARTVPLTLVAGSAPEGWDKRRLLPPPVRAIVLRRKLGRIARRQAGRGQPPHLAAGLFEGGTRMERAVRRARRRRPGWRFEAGKPNNVIRGLKRGNVAVTYGSDLRWHHDVSVDVGRRELHLPVLQSPAMRLRLYVVHRETVRADPDGAGRQAVHDALARDVQRSLRLGYHVVVIADYNGAPPQLPAFDVLARFGVDSISASRGVQLVRTGNVTARRVTDHNVLVVAHVRVELPR